MLDNGSLILNTSEFSKDERCPAGSRRNSLSLFKGSRWLQYASHYGIATRNSQDKGFKASYQEHPVLCTSAFCGTRLCTCGYCTLLSSSKCLQTQNVVSVPRDNQTPCSGQGERLFQQLCLNESPFKIIRSLGPV